MAKACFNGFEVKFTMVNGLTASKKDMGYGKVSKAILT